MPLGLIPRGSRFQRAVIFDDLGQEREHSFPRASLPAASHTPSSQRLTAPCTPIANKKHTFWKSFSIDVKVLHVQRTNFHFVRDFRAMFRVSDSIRHTQTLDGGVLLDVHHGQIFSLNIVGARILELMQKGYDESRIADQISQIYGVSSELARADVTEFIESLHKNRIIETTRVASAL